MSHTATMIDPTLQSPMNLHFDDIQGYSYETEQLFSQGKLLDWMIYKLQNKLPVSSAAWVRANHLSPVDLKELQNFINNGMIDKRSETKPLKSKTCTCGAWITYGRNCSKFSHSQDWCDLLKNN